MKHHFDHMEQKTELLRNSFLDLNTLYRSHWCPRHWVRIYLFRSWECRGRIGRSWWWTAWFSSSTILINARIANRLGCFGSIEIGLFLKFSNILFVSNPFISKPIRNLNYTNIILINMQNDFKKKIFRVLTCETVIPHFLASSSFASSEGYGLLRWE